MSPLACILFECISIAHHHAPVVRLRLVLRFPLSLFPGGRPFVALFVSPVLFPGDGAAAVEEAEVAGAAAAAVVPSTPPSPLTTAAAAAAEVEASPPPVEPLDEATAPAAFAELVAAIVETAEEFIVLLSTVVRLVAVFEVAVSRQGRFCPTTTVGALAHLFVPLLTPEFDGGTLSNDEEGGGGRGPE
jgi:hypothetical protein